MTIKKYTILALTALLFVGCTSDNDNNSLAEERLPLTFDVSLTESRPMTRAVGSQIEADDELLCYVRHISDADVVQSKLITIINGEPTEKLYWDDFSESTDDGAKDLRTDGHGLQSFYGYCYNGGTPSTDLVDATGVLGWTTDVDQTAEGDMKKNDLLWSSTQALVTYQHAKENRSGLEIPYTHAMSKFTIVVVAGEGFKAGDLDATSVTLDGMNLTGTFTAPTATVEATGTTTVKMFANAATTTTDSKPCRAYEAVAVPTTSLAVDKLHATIKNVDGNDYKVLLTDDILTSWADGIVNKVSQSGYNYKLTITLNKQTISVVATLADWTDVSATGTGEINFDADVTNIDKENSAALKKGDSFALWMTTGLASIGTVATTATYDGSKFVNTPAIYWPNGSTNYYFRALAKKTTEHTLDAVTAVSVNQGTDLLWGTTSEHTGKLADNTEVNYTEGAAINPRTGNIPLTFAHVMSNVVVNLTTSSDASAVVLDNATVTLTTLTTDGTIDIATGIVSPGSTQGNVVVTASAIMVPQTIGKESRLIITLADGTTYSLQLNTCKDASDNAINTWEGGHQYTYTISLSKEDIQFRALVKDWTPETGSGNATLDWD